MFPDTSIFQMKMICWLGKKRGLYRNPSRHLRQTCDCFILLDKAMIEQCWLGE
jgi:hypothetical protein